MTLFCVLGHLYVCDTNNECVQMFGADGRYIGAILSERELCVGKSCRCVLRITCSLKNLQQNEKEGSVAETASDKWTNFVRVARTRKSAF